METEGLVIVGKRKVVQDTYQGSDNSTIPLSKHGDKHTLL